MASPGSEADRPPVEVKKAVRAASSTDNWRNVGYLAIDWLVIAGAAAVHQVYPGWLLYGVVTLIIGTRMRALGNLLHEAAHYKLLAHRKLNDLVGRFLCAVPILVPYRTYVNEHRLHHQSLWSAGNDPDLALYQLTRTETASAGRIGYPRFLFWHVLMVIVPLVPLWRLSRSSGPLIRAVVSTAAVGACWLAFPSLGTPLLLYWLVPFLTTHQMITYWAELAEHGGLREAGRAWGSRNWRGNAVSRWMIGSHSDDPYHLLHHWFPSVPHYRLSSVDAVCKVHWPAYAAQDRCSGFFLGARRRVSVLRDVWLGGKSATALPRIEAGDTGADLRISDHDATEQQPQPHFSGR